ncbi:MAG: hypothetical protein ACLU5J_00540 [Christensenellales bacterium]
MDKDPNTGELVITDEKVVARQYGEFIETDSMNVDLIDVSPKQVVAISTACIPFLEHDDTTRALMGANMQRQAIPLVKPEAPYVGASVLSIRPQKIQVLQYVLMLMVLLNMLMV